MLWVSSHRTAAVSLSTGSFACLSPTGGEDKQKGQQIALPPFWWCPLKKSLLDVALQRHVSRELGDEGRTAPVGASTTWIDRGDVGGSRSVESAGEGVAIALREVGVRVAQIQRKHLPGEANT